MREAQILRYVKIYICPPLELRWCVSSVSPSEFTGTAPILEAGRVMSLASWAGLRSFEMLSIIPTANTSSAVLDSRVMRLVAKECLCCFMFC